MRSEQRPRTRADCLDGPRPCPFLGCRHNLNLTEDRRATWHDQLRQTEGNPSCALDLAELGGMTLEEVGRVLGVTRERVRQLEERARARLLAHAGPKLHDLLEGLTRVRESDENNWER